MCILYNTRIILYVYYTTYRLPQNTYIIRILASILVDRVD